jgi:hypothetical protein
VATIASAMMDIQATPTFQMAAPGTKVTFITIDFVFDNVQQLICILGLGT